MECEFEDDIYIGITRAGFKNKYSGHILGSCLDCGKLFSNTQRDCKFCIKAESLSPNINTLRKIKNWLFNKTTPPLSVKFYNEDDIKKILCPKCNYKYLIPYPILFSD